MTDTLGELIVVQIHPANVQDRDGAIDVVKAAIEKEPTLRKLWTDAGYAGRCIETLRATHKALDVEVVRRTDGREHGRWQDAAELPPVIPAGFRVLPRRWVVERTFGWIGRHRRLAKDYEARRDIEQAMVWVALGRTLLRRVAYARPAAPPST